MPPITEILAVLLIVLIAWGIWAFLIRTAGEAQDDLDVPESKNFLTRL